MLRFYNLSTIMFYAFIQVTGRKLWTVSRMARYLPVAALVNIMESSEIHVFETLKKHPLGNRFAADADVKPAVTSWLQTLKNISSTPSKQILILQ